MDTDGPARASRSRWWLPADLVFLTRPVVLGPVWTIYAAGALLAGSDPGWDLLFVTLLVGGVYAHNQIVDADTDLANSKLYLIPHGLVSARTAWIFASVLWGVSLVWAAIHGQRLWLYLAAFLLGLLYNAARPPWRERPWLGLLTNMLAHGPVTFMAGWVAAFGPWPEGALLSLPYAVAVGSVYLSTSIVDVAGDSAAGRQTLPVVRGVSPAAWGALALAALSIPAAALAGDYWLAGAAAVALPAAGWLAYTKSRPAASLSAKVSILCLALSVAVRWPWLAVLAAATFLVSRLYYRARFGITYPSLGGS